jgi:hypothetical protein
MMDSAGVPGRSDALLEELRALDATLATLEVLYRMRLQIERDLLVGSPVGQALRPSA